MPECITAMQCFWVNNIAGNVLLKRRNMWFICADKYSCSRSSDKYIIIIIIIINHITQLLKVFTGKVGSTANNGANTKSMKTVIFIASTLPTRDHGRLDSRPYTLDKTHRDMQRKVKQPSDNGVG